MATQPEPTTRELILDYSRQNQIGELSPWFSERLDRYIERGDFGDTNSLEILSNNIVSDLAEYRVHQGVDTVVLGMSGGVDSALTAALFKRAGWTVVGVTMPIHQVQAETDRGAEACQALGIEHIHADLTSLYDQMLLDLSTLDPDLMSPEGSPKDTKEVRIRRGNVRARARMITLYNLASLRGGLVASTDNFSELTAGFWTLHGDVGDLSPIQSLLKSWEVPYLAMVNGVPESTYRATPTDGLGIDNGDEAQLGASYLEWDIMTLAFGEALDAGGDLAIKSVVGGRTPAEGQGRVVDVYHNVLKRTKATWYKRRNPVNLAHPTQDRYAMINRIDAQFMPSFLK